MLKDVGVKIAFLKCRKDYRACFCEARMQLLDDDILKDKDG